MFGAVIGSIICAAAELSAIILPGVGVPFIKLDLSFFMVMVLPGVTAGAKADRINAKLTKENINTFFIYFLSRIGLAAKYKEFPSSQPEQYDAAKYRQYCLSAL